MNFTEDNTLIDFIKTHLIGKNTEIIRLNDIISNKELELKRLNSKFKNIKEEYENYQKVSIVKNLNNQLFEKDNTIKYLEKHLSMFKTKIKDLETKIKTPPNHVESGGEIDVESGGEGGEIEVESGGEDGEDDVESGGEDGEDEVESGGEDGEDDVESGGEDGEDDVESGGEIEVESGGEIEVESGGDDGEIEVESGGEDGEDGEIEVEFIEKLLKSPNGNGKKIYYISDDINKEIYIKLEDGEIGDCIGKLVGKTNKPCFY